MRISDWSSDVCSSDLRGTEEALGALERVGVDAAGQHLARRGHDGVVGAAQAGDRIEQDHHVLLVLDQPLGLLDHHFGDLDRSEEHTSELQSLMRISYAVFCLKKKTKNKHISQV